MPEAGLPPPAAGEVAELVSNLKAVAAAQGFTGWRCDAVRRAAELDPQ